MIPSIWVVIPSAGKGTRFGATLPKQYQILQGQSVLQHTVNRFLDRQDVRGVVLAVSESDYQLNPVRADARLVTVEGGAERADSVFNALKYLQQHAGSNDLIAVHDAARPCVRQSRLTALFASSLESESGALLAVPAVDTIKWVENIKVAKTMDRQCVYMAQTPQVFRLSLLIEALKHAKMQGIAITDESSAIELMGLQPQIVLGNKDNIKITSIEDLALAEYFLDNIYRDND